MQNNFNILSIDPGLSKWGWAIVNCDKIVIDQGINPTSDLINQVIELHEKHAFKSIILGNSTGSKAYLKKLECVDINLSIELIDEALSTLEARALYFECNPPKGIWRLIPITMQSPSEDYDDYTAIILAKRYWNQSS